MCNATSQRNLGYFTAASQVAEAPTYSNACSQALQEQSVSNYVNFTRS